MEILRRDDDIFKSFGQVYMTTARPGVVKAWHWHKKQDDYFTCISGKMRLALYDGRKRSPTYKEVNEFTISLDEPMLVLIPKSVYHGFKCVSDEEALVINVPTKAYDREKPDEYRSDPYDNDIPYDWRK
jgi:dTDP-4-dehydrorhamnose 3,5-epimerase